jgi:hypothetical protein
MMAFFWNVFAFFAPAFDLHRIDSLEQYSYRSFVEKPQPAETYPIPTS